MSQVSHLRKQVFGYRTTKQLKSLTICSALKGRNVSARGKREGRTQSPLIVHYKKPVGLLASSLRQGRGKMGNL